MTAWDVAGRDARLVILGACAWGKEGLWENAKHWAWISPGASHAAIPACVPRRPSYIAFWLVDPLHADYIADSNPLCNRFIPTTKSLAGIMAGIAEGMFAGLGFPVTVTAARSGTVGETVFVVKMPE